MWYSQKWWYKQGIKKKILIIIVSFKVQFANFPDQISYLIMSKSKCTLCFIWIQIIFFICSWRLPQKRCRAAEILSWRNGEWAKADNSANFFLSQFPILHIVVLVVTANQMIFFVDWWDESWSFSINQKTQTSSGRWYFLTQE